MPSIDCKNMPLHRALRIFKRKVENAGTILEVRKREHYEKPSAKRQRLKNAARRRNQKERKAEIQREKEARRKARRIY
tara:strand:- start:201 stop:434 length:234 start_codon:yes stop_codon:yes gene_type:complete